MLELTLVIISYSLGSVSSAILITRLWSGKDIREIGTRNAGGTNVARNVGLFPALLVGIFDVAKGMLPVLAARFLGLGDGWALAGAIAATLGHSFPIYFNFRGGKGMACAMGAMLVLFPVEGILYIPVFFAIFLVFTGSAVTGGLVALPLLMGLNYWRGYSTFLVFTPLILLLIMGLCALPQAIADWQAHPNKSSLIGFWLSPPREKPDENQPRLFRDKQDYAISAILFLAMSIILWFLLPLSGMEGMICLVVSIAESLAVTLLIVWSWEKLKAKSRSK